MNSLGIHILISLFFILSAILEFAIILCLVRRDEFHRYGMDDGIEEFTREKYRALYRLNTKIDGIALVSFISIFVLFNAVYWGSYLDRIALSQLKC